MLDYDKIVYYCDSVYSLSVDGDVERFLSDNRSDMKVLLEGINIEKQIVSSPVRDEVFELMYDCFDWITNEYKDNDVCNIKLVTQVNMIKHLIGEFK